MIPKKNRPVPKSEQVDDAGLKMQSIEAFTKAMEAQDQEAATIAMKATKDPGTREAMAVLIQYI